MELTALLKNKHGFVVFVLVSKWKDEEKERERRKPGRKIRRKEGWKKGRNDSSLAF